MNHDPTQLRRACRSDLDLGHASDLALGRDALGAAPLGRLDLGQDHSQTSVKIRASCPRKCVGLCISYPTQLRGQDALILTEVCE